MALRPEASLMTALAVGTVVFAIHSNATPTMADVRVGEPNDDNIAQSERAASWLSAGVVAGISLITKDPTVFIIGGMMVVGMAWWTRHANSVNPIFNAISEEGSQPALATVEDTASDEFAA